MRIPTRPGSDPCPQCFLLFSGSGFCHLVVACDAVVCKSGCCPAGGVHRALTAAGGLWARVDANLPPLQHLCDACRMPRFVLMALAAEPVGRHDHARRVAGRTRLRNLGNPVGKGWERKKTFPWACRLAAHCHLSWHVCPGRKLRKRVARRPHCGHKAHLSAAISSALPLFCHF